MKDITWDKIKQGNYAIEEDGRVFSYYKNNYMKTKIDKDGYITICLVTSQGKRSSFGIHRLLMVTYNPCENMDNLIVNHIDGNKFNNSFSNLEWVTSSENVSLAHKTGLNNTVSENHGRAILTEDEAMQIIELLKQGYNSTQIMNKIPKATKKMIFHIKYNETWKHLPR